MKHEEIINIVICYNNVDEVIDYHKKIRQLDNGDEAGFVIVINSEKEENVIKLYEYAQGKKVYIYNPNENLGYMNGLLYGYNKYHKQTNNTPQYIIMSNTDISFPDRSLIKRIMSKGYDDDIWCIGPSIYVERLNSYDNPVAEKRYTIYHINSLIRRFSTPILRELYVTAAFIKPYFIKKKRDAVSKNVYEVHGCFFILSRDFIEFIKDKEYGVFLYSEELYIAENIFRQGKKTYYDADLQINHLEHSTTKKINPTKRAKYFEESMKWIRDEYFTK